MAAEDGRGREAGEAIQDTAVDGEPGSHPLVGALAERDGRREIEIASGTLRGRFRNF
jgi:hypothetical protein